MDAKCPICDEPLRWVGFKDGGLQEAVCCYMVYEKHDDDPSEQLYAKVMSTKVPNGA